MHKSADFKNKEVISINSGKRLGFVSDVEIDYESGAIESIIPSRMYIYVYTVTSPPGNAELCENGIYTLNPMF